MYAVGFHSLTDSLTTRAYDSDHTAFAILHGELLHPLHTSDRHDVHHHLLLLLLIIIMSLGDVIGSIWIQAIDGGGLSDSFVEASPWQR